MTSKKGDGVGPPPSKVPRGRSRTGRGTSAQLAALAAHNRIPMMHEWYRFVHAGGLIS